ncbi:hypothetical protein L209DRAFT_350784 [Thermothelomyces heterothallicus CBS 203.75]
MAFRGDGKKVFVGVEAKASRLRLVYFLGFAPGLCLFSGVTKGKKKGGGVGYTVIIPLGGGLEMDNSAGSRNQCSWFSLPSLVPMLPSSEELTARDALGFQVISCFLTLEFPSAFLGLCRRA